MGKKSREKYLRRQEEKKEKNLNKENYSNKENQINPYSNLEKICFFIVKWGIYLSLFSPLILSTGYFFPFVVPKTIFFRIIVCIIFIAYILLATINSNFRPKVNFLFIFVAVFISILLLTSVLGVDFSRSFWGVFERMEGLLTFFHLFAFYIVLTGFLKEKKDWFNVLTVSIIVAVLASFNVLFSTNPMTRGGGALGNSSFFSAYVLFNLFFAFILAFISKGGWRIFYCSALVVFLASLFFNPLGFTKGVVSSLGFGMGLLILGFMFFSKIRLLKIAVPVVLILLTLAGIFIVQGFYFQDREFSLRNFPDRSRQVIWGMAWQGWQERPWFGWGLENFNTPFAKYHDPELPTTGDIWYDRVHNIVLDTGIASGIIGVLSYLFIFGAAVFALTRLLPKAKDMKDVAVPLAMIVLLFVYFLQNFWVFDMISTHIMFFMTLAFISFWVSQKTAEQGKKIKEKIVSIPVFISSFLIVLTFSALIFGNIQPSRASKFIAQGISLPLEQAMPAFEKAFKSSPMAKFEGPEQVSSKLTSLSTQAGQDRELLRQGFELAEEKFKENISQNPLNFRAQLFLGRHYNIFYQFTGDKTKLDLSQKSLEKALELGPNNQQAYFILAETMLTQGEKQKAIDLLKKAADLEPRYFQARMYLIRGYRMTEEYEKAFNELEKLEEIGYLWQENDEILKERTEILKKTGEDIINLIPLYERGIEINSQNIALWQDLINAFVQTNEIEKAKKTIETFSQVNPEYKSEADQFLRQLEELVP